MAVENGSTNAMYNLGHLYASQFKKYNEAEKYYKMTIDKLNKPI